MAPTQSFTDTVRIPAPAAGANATRRIPGEYYERLETARFSLTASAAVANRFVSVDYLDGDNNVVARYQSATAVTAGQTIGFTFSTEIGSEQAGGSGEQLLPITEVVYPPGFKVRVTVANIDVADQLSTIFATIRHYPSQEWVASPGATPYTE